MAHTTLPAAHSDADAVLAQQIGRRLKLRELHVFWTHPMSEPSRRVATEEKSESPGLTGALAALGALLERVSGLLIAPRPR